MDKVVFLDRDGVINKKAPPHQYITKWKEFSFISGVPEAIKKLNSRGYKIVVVSNQRCIARGLATAGDIEKLHRSMREALAKRGARIDAVFYCPHEVGQCHCRKPEIGLFLQAEKLYDIDKTQSYMIGDEETDIQAGHHYGIRSILVGGKSASADYSCPALLGAVDYISKGG